MAQRDKNHRSSEPAKFALISVITVMTLLFLPVLQAPAHAQDKRLVTKEEDQKTLNYKEGELISFVMVDNKPDNRAAAGAYFKRAFPIASSFGFANDMTFGIERIIGDFAPDAFVIYSWPSAAAETGFNNHPDWPAIKALRPQIWNDLRVYTAVVEDDMSLSFRPDRYYTLAVAWTSDENPNDYSRYFEIIEQEVAAIGGRFLYKMRMPNFESHAFDGKGPGQLTLVEWETIDGFQQLVRSDTYQQQGSPYFRSGVDYVEFYNLNPR